MSPSSTPPQGDYTTHEPTQSPRALATHLVSSAVAPFLASLFDILSKEDASVIAWCDDGKSFGVYNYDAMEKHILPTYFRHNKFASFQRQLNYFGFRKLHKAKDSDHHSIYCQPCFLRHDPSRMLQIKRKTHRVKSNTPRRAILGSLHDGYPYHYAGYSPVSPACYVAHAESPSGNVYSHDTYYTSPHAPYTPSSTPSYTTPQATSADAYDPLPFYAPTTNVFMAVASSPSACSHRHSTDSADLAQDPFLPVKHHNDHYSYSHAVVVPTHCEHSSLSALPIPFSDVQRDSVKLTRDDLDFLYDDALCI